jgi:hypothetical protein
MLKLTSFEMMSKRKTKHDALRVLGCLVGERAIRVRTRRVSTLENAPLQGLMPARGD